MKTRKYDLVWVEYEVLPWFPYWIEALFLRGEIPYVIDYDDAIFHRYDMHRSMIVRLVLGKKIDHLMKASALVIAGNEYIADRAQQAGVRNIEILPTVVDLGKYSEDQSVRTNEFVIGWIGTPVTSHYLMLIHEALREVAKAPHVRIVAVGAGNLSLDGVPIDVRAWSEQTEIDEMRRFDVGIMPLTDSPWERGKCGHKLIKYMACSRAVVASPVGVNPLIVDNGVNGFLAATNEEWTQALVKLRDNPVLRKSMGEAGRTKVEAEYSTEVTAPRLFALLSSIRGTK